MDRITKSYLENFSNNFSLDKKLDESVRFEHFVNYTLIEPKICNSMNLEAINIGKRIPCQRSRPNRARPNRPAKKTILARAFRGKI